jgi:protein-S-isoprenylcysteine O-methyltransferase Ste14
MGGFFSLVYAVVCYALFLGAFLHTIGFVANVPGLKTIDGGTPGDVWTAVAVDVALLGAFAVQHSIMARRWFKEWWTRFVPRQVERSTYVLAASLVVGLLLWQWQPIPATVWSVDGSTARIALYALSGLGWTIVLVATFLINHFELFGLKQAVDYWRERQVEPPTFRTPALYKLVRHPLYFGFILAFWATPQMSVGHLLFAFMTTGYILVGIFFEERDLIVQFGSQYRRYRAEVGMLLPRLGGRSAARVAQRNQY